MWWIYLEIDAVSMLILYKATNTRVSKKCHVHGWENNMKNEQKYNNYLYNIKNIIKLNTWMDALEVTARFLEPT